MKPLVLIISRNPADCRAIKQAALANGCRAVTFSRSEEAVRHAVAADPVLVFCDAALAQSGSLLRGLGRKRSIGALLTLIVSQEVNRGMIRSLVPWAHDHITSPLVREIAAAHIRNSLRMLYLKSEVNRKQGAMRSWLKRIEDRMEGFDPLSHDGGTSTHDIARTVLEGCMERGMLPAFLLIGEPDDAGSLKCDLFRLSCDGVSLMLSDMLLTEPSAFLGVRYDSGLAALNLSGKERSRSHQPAFPPQLMKMVGEVKNMVASFHGGRYVVALNFDKRVNRNDALELRGISLPGVFLGSISEKVRDVSESFLILVHGLALAADSQGDNGAHVSRMEQYATTLAGCLGLPDRLVRSMGFSARLHDVGKIYIHPDLLEKPLRLTPREFELIKKHPVLGVRILGQSPLLETARRISLTHHECWDGSGYPQSLSGNAIPIEGAIVKMGDIYDALRTMHAYKSPLTHAEACELILRGGGDGFHETRPAHFHPDVLRAFRTVTSRFEEIYSLT